MRVPGLEDVHLTYCLNVHPGGSLAEAEAAAFDHGRGVLERVGREAGIPGPYGLGLWLSAEAAGQLTQRATLEAFAARLAAESCYAFTLNGFPYGRFHGARVKRKVYRPDWSEPSRTHYTIRLARILARLLPEDTLGTISTLPITYKSWADEPKLLAAVDNLAQVTAALADLERDTGREICLALEPEPDCFLERADDAIAFFTQRLLPEGGERLARRLDCSTAEARLFLVRHVGVCLDAIHAAVRFEDPCETVRRLAASGIRVAKIHLGAALDLTVGPDGPPPALDAFKEDVYLHQVTVRTADGDLAFPDLPDAYASERDVAGHWRVHYHVPLTWPGTAGIGTTGGLITEELLATAVDLGVRHFELETYTLGVFPDALPSVEDVMARDLAWLLARFPRAEGRTGP